MIGIDPGITGAIAYDDGVIDIPVQPNGIDRKVKMKVDHVALLKLLKSLRDVGETEVVLEEQVYRPVMDFKTKKPRPGGGASAFSLGDTYGVLRAMCHAVGFKVHVVTPTTWKKYMQLSKDKEASLDMARHLRLDCEIALKRKKDHNRAEAILLRHYGVKTCK